MKRQVTESDVLDELRFIADVQNNYTISQRQTANRLLKAYKDTIWDPTEEIKRVIDLLENRYVEIPRLPKKRKKVLVER